MFKCFTKETVLRRITTVHFPIMKESTVPWITKPVGSIQVIAGFKLNVNRGFSYTLLISYQSHSRVVELENQQELLSMFHRGYYKAAVVLLCRLLTTMVNEDKSFFFPNCSSFCHEKLPLSYHVFIFLPISPIYSKSRFPFCLFPFLKI